MKTDATVTGSDADTKRTIGYVCSTSVLEAAGITAQAQREIIRDYCSSHGLILLETYEDNPAHYADSRPEFKRALDFILGCKSKRLVIYNNSVWARNAEHEQEVLMQLQEKAKDSVELDKVITGEQGKLDGRRSTVAA